jgi:hypothetical protein
MPTRRCCLYVLIADLPELETGPTASNDKEIRCGEGNSFDFGALHIIVLHCTMSLAGSAEGLSCAHITWLLSLSFCWSESV